MSIKSESPLVVSAILGLAFSAQAQDLYATPLRHIDGFVAGSYTGYSVANAGDVNKDGVPDLVIGSPAYANAGLTGQGRAYVRSGKDGKWLYSWGGSKKFARAGHAVAGLGDLNKDGHSEVIVGMPGDSTQGTGAGKAVVYSGKTGKALYTYYGEAGGSGFGTAVARIDDIDGDKIAEYAISAPYPNTRSPLPDVTLYSGATGKKLWVVNGTQTRGEFGLTIANAGDLNGDGRGDLLVGSPAVGGVLGLQSGGVTAVLGGLRRGTVLYRVAPTKGEGRFGAAIASFGDVNDDKIPDFVVGAPNSVVKRGAHYVCSGKDGKILYRLLSKGAIDDRFGFRVSAAGGDVDKDGKPDYVVAAPFAQGWKGQIFVMSGKTNRVLFALTGTRVFDQLGHSMAVLGDITGDGRSELLISSPGWDGAKANIGRVTIFQPRRNGKVTSLGTGCAGAVGVPVLTATPARIGQRYDIRISRLQRSAFGLLIVGLTRQNIDLQAIGMKGCTLYTEFYTYLNFRANSAGLIGYKAPLIRNNRAWIGAHFHLQYATLEGQTHLGYSMSNALAMRIGE